MKKQSSESNEPERLSNPVQPLNLTVDQLERCGVSKVTAEVYVPILNPRLTGAGITTKLRLAHLLAQLIAESGFKPRSEDLGKYTAKNIVSSWKEFRRVEVYGPPITPDAPPVYQTFAMKDGLVVGNNHKPLPLTGNHLAFANRFIAESKQDGGDFAKALGNRVYANRNGNGDESSGDGYKYRGHGLIQITGRNNYKALKEATKVDYLQNPDLLDEPLGAVVSALWFWKVNDLNKYADADQIFPISGVVNRGSYKLEAHGLTNRRKALERCKIALGITPFGDNIPVPQPKPSILNSIPPL